MPLKCPKILGNLNNYFLYCNMHLPIHKKLCDVEEGGSNNRARRFRNLRGLGIVAYQPTQLLLGSNLSKSSTNTPK